MGDIEMDAKSGNDGPGVPTKATDVDDKDLKLKMVCPMFAPGLRDKLYKWYPGPEFCAHRMHWTEWLFAIFLILAILFTVLKLGIGIGIPSSVIGAILFVNAFLATAFIWGFAKYKSLADLAGRLEKLAEENHKEVGAYQEINNEWDEGLKRGQENLNQFTASLGLVQDDAEALNGLTEALQSLVSQKKKIQAEERALFEIQVKHQKVTRAEIDEKERSTMKKQLIRFYDRITRSGSSRSLGKEEKDNSVNSPEEIEALRKKLQENKFLNSCKPGTDEPNFEWLPEFEEIAEDGVVSKYELLDALDKATNSYFLEVKNARDIQSSLEEELERVRGVPL
mmetsp:Transcript_2228/g.2996  ORF Transcript_2228/g.2996 Transcript_2228/m.2996 type:complete len:338 (+) Transcript_2228:43-1056(+)|eukprot:CAMPEP_0175101370 /NCGR_PEP_ID=MMETSP0086_2-20121207/7754_1 /TAXON_ID=136419 /ORGANISM="Unknown Unknown, Strain D1" /LENGTH=337 /DNA_ID=CAMNT_0016375883 /DNA_START=56 /DNA_END=1069 /DNA_ORIENTATION=+